jgi:hypothetical protein
MKTPPFPYQLSRRGWISVAYNQNIWIPCQPVFPEGFDRRSWARLYAEEWWSRTSRPHGKREISALARTLEDLHAYAYRHLPMHLGFLHLPSLQLAPLLVSFGIWEAAGDRAEQLRFLTRADDPAFMQPPRGRGIRHRQPRARAQSPRLRLALRGTGHRAAHVHRRPRPGPAPARPARHRGPRPRRRLGPTRTRQRPQRTLNPGTTIPQRREGRWVKPIPPEHRRRPWRVLRSPAIPRSANGWPSGSATTAARGGVGA